MDFFNIDLALGTYFNSTFVLKFLVGHFRLKRIKFFLLCCCVIVAIFVIYFNSSLPNLKFYSLAHVLI